MVNRSQYHSPNPTTSNGTPFISGIHLENEELHYKEHLYLTNKAIFNSQVLSKIHASPIIGHSGFHKTYERIKYSFLWEALRRTLTPLW
jgi:hypothetical protein